MAADEVRRCVVTGRADRDSTHVVIPKAVADRLGLPFSSKTRVTFADGRQVEREIVGQLRLRVCGRESTFRAIVDPQRDDVLVGTVALDTLDLTIDAKTHACHASDPEQHRTFV